MKVLHLVERFIHVTENWIYPQVAAVPGVQSCILCNSTLNLDAFPYPEERIITRLPRSPRRLSMRRIGNKVLKIAGKPEFLIERSIIRQQPVLVHAHFGNCGWAFISLFSKLRIPVIVSFYGYDAWLLPESKPEWKERYACLFENAALILAEGPAMRRRLIALGCPPEKVRVHKIGIDLERFDFLERDFSQPLNVVMVGRFVEKKGLADGLTAFSLALQKWPKCHMTIVGGVYNEKDVNGPRIERELLNLVRSRMLGDSVTFTGLLSVQELGAVLKDQHVFLCPSKMSSDGDAEGGSPVVLTEAMAHGLFCIGTRHCDIPEVILEEETGYLCEEGDTAGMAERLCRVASDPAHSLRLTRNGRAHVERNFSLSAQLMALGTIYREVVDAP